MDVPVPPSDISSATPSASDEPGEPEVFEQIAAIIRDSLDEPDLVLTPATTARDVEGWDSIAMINIILDVQKTFDLRFRSSEVDKLASIGDFVALTRAKMRAAAMKDVS